MKYNHSKIAAFAKIARSDRAFGRYVRDLVALGEALKDDRIKANKMSLLGVHHAVDEVKVLMALRAAQDEVELEMKSAMLIGAPPMILMNSNLPAMLEAALLSDTQRLQPASLPIELRMKFRI